MESKWTKWTREEEARLLEGAILLEGLESLVCPPLNPNHPAKLRRKQGYFNELADLLPGKSPEQCKAKLQKLQVKVKGRADLLSLDFPTCAQLILTPHQLGLSFSEAVQQDGLASCPVKFARSKRIRKQRQISVFQPVAQNCQPSRPKSPVSVLISTDSNNHKDPGFTIKFSSDGIVLDLSDGLFGSTAQTSNTGNDLIPSGLHQDKDNTCKVDLFSSQLEARRHWQKTRVAINNGIAGIPIRSKTTEVELIFKTLSDKFENFFRDFDCEVPRTQELFATVATLLD